jgi:hypothetical protein
MTEPDRSPPGDELTQRYREASAQDTRRPGAHVRDAVRAHAQMVIAAGRPSTAGSGTPKPPAANQSRWKISALAGLALAGLTGLLVLQYDRGTDEDKDLAFGQPSASAPPATAPAPAPAPAPAAAPAIAAPATLPADKRGAKTGPADSTAPAVNAPAKPVAGKPAPQPAATGSIAPKAETEAAPPPLASTAPPLPAPQPPAPAPAAPAQESAQFARSARLADAAAGGQAAPSAPSPQAAAPAAAVAIQPPAPVAAPAPAMAAPVPAAPAAAAQEQKRERLSASTPPLRAEAPGTPRLAGALQDAARAGNLPLLERLIRQGAALNAADAAGRTPLILAAMQGHTAVVQRLLAAGANTALIDHDGLNALQHARRLGFDGIAHLIETAP